MNSKASKSILKNKYSINGGFATLRKFEFECPVESGWTLGKYQWRMVPWVNWFNWHLFLKNIEYLVNSMKNIQECSKIR